MAEEKELIVRKTTSALIEKFFVYSGYDLPHDTYKEILYNNKKCMSNKEDKIKRYYDGYMFLLHNSSNILSSKILLIFFYIIYQKETDINVINKIINKHVFNEGLPSLEKAINLLLIINDELSFTDKIDKLLIPLMFFNYELVKNNIPSIRLVRNDIIKYEKLIEDKNKEELFIFFKNIIDNFEFFEKSYFDNLKELSLSDIIKVFRKNEEELKSIYKVKKLIIYGSYAKGINRYDSDIDILIRLDNDLTFKERLNIINELKEKYKNIFNRFVDIEEIAYFFDDNYLKEINGMKIIIS